MRNFEVYMRNFIDLIQVPKISESFSNKGSFLLELHNLNEKSPPSEKAEKFIKSSKKDFKKRYGKNWKRVLYATAWKNFDKMNEAYESPESYGYWITANGEVLEVDDYNHNRVARDWIRKNKPDVIIDDSHREATTNYVIREMGWIRVVNEYHNLSFEFMKNGISSISARIAINMIEDLENYIGPRDIIIVTLNSFSPRDNTVIPAHELRKAIQILRKNINRVMASITFSVKRRD